MSKVSRAFGIAILTLAALRVSAQQEPKRESGLQRLLEAELERFPAKAGVWVKHLTSGEEARVHADEMFNSASVIKIPVMVLAFRMADRGELLLGPAHHDSCGGRSRRIGRTNRVVAIFIEGEAYYAAATLVARSLTFRNGQCTSVT